MTKAVRIENADTGLNKEVVVEVYDNDAHSYTEVLSSPTHQTQVVLSQGRKVILTERDVGEATTMGSGGPIGPIGGDD